MPLESNVLTTTLNVALVCPIILSLHKPPEVNAAGTDLVIKTLESVMARKTVTEPNIYRTLSNILGWRSLEQVPPLENVIKEFATLFQIEDFKVLSTLNPAAFEDLRFNLVKSLELAFYHMTHWNIVYDDFVRNVVWPMMNEEALADIALELMVLLGQFGLPKNDTEQEKKGVRFIRDRLLHILSVTDMPPEGDSCPRHARLA
ncbi:uncharacterized protein BYT42DRAFT_174635 [Radiomyces spectabilis]|uniref:uncharacterized protein n=1 Tax=Radiomyces spectabilis TaxID=64574 RepID=UPI00221EC7AA|nr:uncharacterized protein BYT42DRAFT_174635 [Radiomyces spectabilis]KAI8390916.1 hypothetical protein BYT42DRAFT_174635 [Radiomyces spectabilis]